MSGTSMDGIDVALLDTDGQKEVRRSGFGFFPYDTKTRALLAQALEDALRVEAREQRPGCLPEAEALITHLHGEAVNAFLAEHKLKPDDIDLIGFHGQTVLHRPDQAMTVQLGDGAALASTTGINTVYDMRAGDMLHGGQGAPLIPVYHRALAANVVDEYRAQTPVCFVNIGGISNITFVGERLIAFDCGPGNALIDQWVKRRVGISHDQGGIIAAEGEIDAAFVEAYLADPFFDQSVPKSLDRNDFKLPEKSGLSVETVARSLARLSAEAIFKARDHLPRDPKLWIVCGGGRHNPHIMNDMKTLADEQGCEVISAEQAGFDGDAMEAEGWAYLAVRSAYDLPLTLPETTGCSMPVCGGVLAVPRNT